MVHDPPGKSLPRNHRFHKAMAQSRVAARSLTPATSRERELDKFSAACSVSECALLPAHHLFFHLFEGGKVAAAPLSPLLRNMGCSQSNFVLFFFVTTTKHQIVSSRISRSTSLFRHRETWSSRNVETYFLILSVIKK